MHNCGGARDKALWEPACEFGYAAAMDPRERGGRVVDCGGCLLRVIWDARLIVERSRVT